MVYASADLTKATQHAEVIAVAEHWKAAAGTWPARLVFDSRLTTQRHLATLDERGIRFVTLRTRSPAVLAQIAAIPAGAYRQVTLDRTGPHRTPKIADTTVRLSAYPHPIRQLVITGLGHDEPTVLITNDTASSPKQLLEHYAHRMTIEQRLGEAIRASTSTPSPVPSHWHHSMWISTSPCPCSPTPSARRCAADSPAIRPRLPTPCSAGSCP